jgi:hypothetical protein
LDYCEFKLKTLAKLFLVAGIGLGSLSLSAQDFKLPHETDAYKFIPKGAGFELVLIDTGYGFFSWAHWYHKGYTAKDYQDKKKELKGKIPGDEIFLDLDRDGIPDLSAKELDDLYSQYLAKQELERTSL